MKHFLYLICSRKKTFLSEKSLGNYVLFNEIMISDEVQEASITMIKFSNKKDKNLR